MIIVNSSLSTASIAAKGKNSEILEVDKLEQEKRWSGVGATSMPVISTADTSTDQAPFSDSIELLRDADVAIVSQELAEGLGATEVASDATYVSADAIEGLFYESQLDSSLVGLDLIESTVLLLKNGWAYKGLRSSPLDLQVPEPEAVAEGNWSLWRNVMDRGYELLDTVSQTWNPVPGFQVDTRPLEPADVAGQFTRARTQNWGGTIFTSEQTFTLTADGKFGTSRSNLVGGGGIGSLVPHTTATTYNSEDMTGSRSIVSANSNFSQGVSSTTLTETRLHEILGDRVGDYALLDDGLTIEFNYANGDVRRELFFHHNDNVYIDDRSYTRQSISTDAFMLALHALLMHQTESISKNWLAEIAKAREKYGRAKPEPSTTGLSLPKGDTNA